VRISRGKEAKKTLCLHFLKVERRGKGNCRRKEKKQEGAGLFHMLVSERNARRKGKRRGWAVSRGWKKGKGRPGECTMCWACGEKKEEEPKDDPACPSYRAPSARKEDWLSVMMILVEGREGESWRDQLCSS